MSLLGALFGGDGGSSSTSASTTTTADNRIVQGTGAIQATNGSAVTVLDGNAIGTSADVANRSVSRVVDLGAFVTDKMGKTVDSALGFGSEALSFGSDALASNNKAITSSLDLVGDVVNGHFAANDKTLTKAFNFGTDALSGALGFITTANTQANNAQSDALQTAVGALTNALSFGKAQTATALDSLNTSANLVKDSYADAKGRGALTDYITLAAIAGALLVAFMALKK